MRVATVLPVEIGPAVIPLVTALVAAALAARVGGSAVRRFAPAKALWAVGLALFAIAAAAEAYGAADGWGPASFRVYYLAGGCLSGEHGVGIEKRDLMAVQFSPVDMEAQLRVKDVFDPTWLLNPAKVFPLHLTASRRAGC